VRGLLALWLPPALPTRTAVPAVASDPTKHWATSVGPLLAHSWPPPPPYPRWDHLPGGEGRKYRTASPRSWMRMEPATGSIARRRGASRRTNERRTPRATIHGFRDRFPPAGCCCLVVVRDVEPNEAFAHLDRSRDATGGDLLSGPTSSRGDPPATLAGWARREADARTATRLVEMKIVVMDGYNQARRKEGSKGGQASSSLAWLPVALCGASGSQGQPCGSHRHSRTPGHAVGPVVLPSALLVCGAAPCNLFLGGAIVRQAQARHVLVSTMQPSASCNRYMMRPLQLRRDAAVDHPIHVLAGTRRGQTCSASALSGAITLQTPAAPAADRPRWRSAWPYPSPAHGE
jgi:hypothetical protein